MILCARNRCLSYGTPIRKSHKKKAENSLFQFSFTLLKCFVFGHLYAFNDSKVVKCVNIKENLLKND